MKSRILLIIIPILFMFLVNAKFLNQDELEAIDEALEVINCNRTDLNFEKKWGGDKFLLDPVRKSLDEPLELPEISHHLKEKLTSSIVL